jgi:hypothetical protein
MATTAPNSTTQKRQVLSKLNTPTVVSSMRRSRSCLTVKLSAARASV